MNKLVNGILKKMAFILFCVCPNDFWGSNIGMVLLRVFQSHLMTVRWSCPNSYPLSLSPLFFVLWKIREELQSLPYLNSESPMSFVFMARTYSHLW